MTPKWSKSGDRKMSRTGPNSWESGSLLGFFRSSFPGTVSAHVRAHVPFRLGHFSFFAVAPITQLDPQLQHIGEAVSQFSEMAPDIKQKTETKRHRQFSTRDNIHEHSLHCSWRGHVLFRVECCPCENFSSVGCCRALMSTTESNSSS